MEELQYLLVDVLLIGAIGYHIKVFNSGLQKQKYMRSKYKFFYAMGFTGFIFSMILLFIFINVLGLNLLTFPFELLIGVSILILAPLSAIINVYSWIKNAQYNQEIYHMALPLDYNYMKKKLYICVVGGCLAMGAILCGIVEVYMDGSESPIIRNWKTANNVFQIGK